jgi:hypothetical protein
MPNPIDTLDRIADGVNAIANDERTPEVVAAVKGRIPTKARRVIYDLGVGLGALAAFGAVIVSVLDGQPALIGAAVVGAALAVSNLIAKSHIAD